MARLLTLFFYLSSSLCLAGPFVSGGIPLVLRCHNSDAGISLNATFLGASGEGSFSMESQKQDVKCSRPDAKTIKSATSRIDYDCTDQQQDFDIQIYRNKDSGQFWALVNAKQEGTLPTTLQCSNN